MLESLRSLPGLTERSTGTFYRGSVAFLHFHADPAGLFADLKVDGEFVRSRTTTKSEQQRLVRAARRSLGA
ncbi:MAG TPA: hypothetical protein VIC35_05920 [Acidimicrobiia bacterium]|jgi:hypothetical protein